MWHNLVNEMSAWNSSYCEAKRMQIGESCTSQIVRSHEAVISVSVGTLIRTASLFNYEYGIAPS